MSIESFETDALEISKAELNIKKSELHKGFESSVLPENRAFSDIPEHVEGNIRRWLDISTEETAIRFRTFNHSVLLTIQQMYGGTVLDDGTKTLGLKEISEWKMNDEYHDQIIKQRAGYAAEVIGTTKENIKAEFDGTGIKTYRADDCPDLYRKNDQYVDKIRVNADGEVIERIQVKFVGHDAKSCLSKLMSKEYEKYIFDGKVDKIEVPKEYYEGIKNHIQEQTEDLETQLEHVNNAGKAEAAEGIKNRINQLKKLDEMLEQSTVTKDEAIYAVEHPQRYVMKLMAEDVFMKNMDAGNESKVLAVSADSAVSTVDNVSQFMNGEISAQDAFGSAIENTIENGAERETAFVSIAVEHAMESSSHELLRSLSYTGVPEVIVNYGVESYESIVDYSTGVISGQQLAYDLGLYTAETAGYIGGTAAGVMVDSAFPGVIPYAPLIGGEIGMALASEAYVTAVSYGSEYAGVLADKAQEMANTTVEIAKNTVPEKVESVVSAINEFASKNQLPFSV